MEGGGGDQAYGSHLEIFSKDRGLSLSGLGTGI